MFCFMNISAPYEIIGEGQPVLAIVTPSSSLAANARDGSFVFACRRGWRND